MPKFIHYTHDILALVIRPGHFEHVCTPGHHLGLNSGAASISEQHLRGMPEVADKERDIQRSERLCNGRGAVSDLFGTDIAFSDAGTRHDAGEAHTGRESGVFEVAACGGMEHAGVA